MAQRGGSVGRQGRPSFLRFLLVVQLRVVPGLPRQSGFQPAGSAV